MLDTSTSKGRIVSAALALAAPSASTAARCSGVN